MAADMTGSGWKTAIRYGVDPGGTASCRRRADDFRRFDFAD
jgi:hypothetical protein